MRRPRRLYLLLLTALLLVVLGVGLPVGYRWYHTLPHVKAQRLAEARARWAQRDFEAYQITVVSGPPMTIGRQETYTGKRRFDPMAHYFELIESHPHDNDPRCAALRLECILPVTRRVQVDYDPHLGYPRTINLSATSHPDWLNPDFWAMLWQTGMWRECPSLTCTFTNPLIITIEVTPLP
jgi:hypothetical protein